MSLKFYIDSFIDTDFSFSYLHIQRQSLVFQSYFLQQHFLQYDTASSPILSTTSPLSLFKSKQPLCCHAAPYHTCPQGYIHTHKCLRKWELIQVSVFFYCVLAIAKLHTSRKNYHYLYKLSGQKGHKLITENALGDWF